MQLIIGIKRAQLNTYIYAYMHTNMYKYTIPHIYVHTKNPYNMLEIKTILFVLAK